MTEQLTTHHLDQPKSLDHAMEKQYLSKIDLWRAEFSRAIGGYLRDLPKIHQSMLDAARKKFTAEDQKLRLTDATHHPSHRFPPILRENFRYFRNEILADYAINTKDPKWTTESCLKEIGEHWSKQIFDESRDSLSLYHHIMIEGDASLVPEAIQRLGGKMQHIHLTADPLVDQESGDLTAKAREEISKIIQDLKHDVEGSTQEHEEDPYDETEEAISYSKEKLKTGAAETYTIWIDYDGAKRTSGQAFREFFEMIYDDIRENDNLLNDNEKQEVRRLRKEFKNINKINHALTELLKKSKAQSKPQLEAIMHVLIQERFSLIKTLNQFKNTVKSRRSEQEDPDFIWLSDRIRFNFRLDNKTIQAACDKEFNEKFGQFGATKPVDQAQLRMLNSVIGQAISFNQLGQDTQCICFENGTWKNVCSTPIPAPEYLIAPQIMVAMCKGSEDIKALFRQLRENDAGGEYKAIALTPLFEEEKTTSPEFITDFLNKMWDFFQNEYGDEGVAERFTTHIPEIFVAGSDLSKEMGQTPALVRAVAMYGAIAKFNREKEINIDFDIDKHIHTILKMGSGEAAFRQGSGYDPEGYKPFLRGKILDPNENQSEEEKKERQNAIEKLKNIFHLQADQEDHLKEILNKPRKAVRMSEQHPFHVSTSQARSEELALTLISPPRISKMREDLAQNIQALVGKEKDLFDPEKTTQEQFDKYISDLIPAEMQEIVNAEKEFFQDLVGTAAKPEESKGALGFLYQVATSDFPLPNIRNRNIARKIENQSIYEKFEADQKAGIKTRAIGTNASSNFIYPAYLLGKGALLDKANKQGGLTEVINKLIDPKELLRYIKVFGTTAENNFRTLEQCGLDEEAQKLRAEWEKLCKYIKPLQDAIWQEEIAFWKKSWQEKYSEDLDINLNDQTKETLVTLAVPGMRELLADNMLGEDSFKSKYTILAKQNFQANPEFLQIVANYYAKGKAFEKLLNEKAQESDKTKEEIMAVLLDRSQASPADLAQAYREFEKASGAFKQVDGEKYDRFLSTAVDMYGAGM